MSGSSDRLQQALATLAKDVADLWLAHADLHAKGTGGCGCGGEGEKPDTSGSEVGHSHHVPAQTACAPAYVGPGVVRVSAPAQTAGPQPGPVPVVGLPAGIVSSEQYQASVSTKASASGTEVVASLPTTLPVRPYIGRLRDASGAMSTPFVIYLDGLQ